MTYLEYVNVVLQGVNEVPLTSQQFTTTRGLHQFAKESINRTYFDLIQEYQWPWMQSQANNGIDTLELSGERSIVPTTQWTQIPVTNPYKDSIDWSSIYYKDSLGEKYPLTVVSWDQFEDSQEFIENDELQRYIVQSADGRSMGIYKMPTTNIGKLYYRIWSRPSRFVNATDIIPMPDIHFNVLVDGALHHLWSFRGNVEQSQLAYARFTKGIKKMKLKYGNQTTRMRWV